MPSCEHEVTEFRTQEEAGRGRSKIRTLGFNEADFDLFEELQCRMSWESVKRDNVPRRGGQFVKNRDAQTNKPVCLGTLAEDVPS